MGDILAIAQIIFTRPSTLAVLAVGTLLAVTVVPVLSRSLGWRSGWTATAGVALAGLLAAVFGRETSFTNSDSWWQTCEWEGASFSTPQELLNVLLFMPFAFCAVLGTGRPVGVLLGSVGISLLVEIAQSVSQLGICTSGDLLHNASGAAVAVGLGLGARRVLDALRGRRAE